MERTYSYRVHPALKVLKFIGYIILGAFAAAAFALIFGYLIMWLWNWLMPTLFGLTIITFWQAVGIAFLARLIFGGGKHGSSSSKKHSPKKEFMSHWRKEYRKERKCGDWKYFDDFWKHEGERAYSEFIEKQKENKEKKEDVDE